MVVVGGRATFLRPISKKKAGAPFFQTQPRSIPPTRVDPDEPYRPVYRPLVTPFNQVRPFLPAVKTSRQSLGIPGNSWRPPKKWTPKAGETERGPRDHQGEPRPPLRRPPSTPPDADSCGDFTVRPKTASFVKSIRCGVGGPLARFARCPHRRRPPRQRR